MTKKLTKRELTTNLKTISTTWGVTDDGTSLVRTFTFARFIDSFMFVTRLGIHAEVMKQYPRIMLEQQKVTLTLGDFHHKVLTVDNFDLAKKIDVIFTLSTTTARGRISRD